MAPVGRRLDHPDDTGDGWTGRIVRVGFCRLHEASTRDRLIRALRGSG
jgi:hypothetical protein